MSRRRTTPRDLAIVDERERFPERSLTSLFRKHHRDPRAFKRAVPTRKIGRSLDLAPAYERRLQREPMPMLAYVDGRPTVVLVRPANDSQYNAMRQQDSAVYASVVHNDDSRLSKHAHRVVVDADTGTRYRFVTDGDTIRDATDTGDFELRELFYSSGKSVDVAALLEGTAA